MPQHARPHGEEARAARRLEPWQQIRTRGHPSRRPRFARAPQDEVGVMDGFTASQPWRAKHAEQASYVSFQPAARGIFSLGGSMECLMHIQTPIGARP